VRRRTPTPTSTGQPTPPPELAHRCHVADWISPGEPTPALHQALTRSEWALVAAAVRWRDARAAWLATHHIPPDQHCHLIPYRAPRPAPHRP
jgi:hypothetical protein